MKSIGKLSYFNFQWTKALYQNNFQHTAFFSTLVKAYKCNKLSVRNNSEGKVLIGAREKLQKPQISQNEILCMTILSVFSQFL